MPLSAAERSARARLGAFAQHAQHSTRDTTAAARSAFLARFEVEVDPNHVLTPEERARRAEAARRAYFARLTLQRLRTRSKKKRDADPGEESASAEIVTGGSVDAA